MQPPTTSEIVTMLSYRNGIAITKKTCRAGGIVDMHRFEE